MKKLEAGTYTVFNIRAYNTVISLLKEHSLPLIRVETCINEKNEETVRITTQGERCYIEFIRYLLMKSQEKEQKLLKGLKINEELSI